VRWQHSIGIYWFRSVGFSPDSISFQYLGCPIFQGKPKCIHFRAIVDRIKVKLAYWKGALLSIMGRVQLIKSIVHGMLVYSFHIYQWPIKLLNLLDQWIKNFIWRGDITYTKICTVALRTICLSWEAEGLDLKPTCVINCSLLLHLSWNLVNDDSQCALMVRQRFLSYGRPILHHFKSSVWQGVKEHMTTVLCG